MVEICNNHPMFQFLFDEFGNLLTANKRAMFNLKGVESVDKSIMRINLGSMTLLLQEG